MTVQALFVPFVLGVVFAAPQYGQRTQQYSQQPQQHLHSSFLQQPTVNNANFVLPQTPNSHVIDQHLFVSSASAPRQMHASGGYGGASFLGEPSLAASAPIQPQNQFGFQTLQSATTQQFAAPSSFNHLLPQPTHQQQFQQTQLNLQQPQLNAQKTQLNAKQKQLNAQNPQLNAQQPQLNAQQPQLNAQKPQLNAKQPQLNAQQPKLNAQQPQLNAQQPQLNAQQPQLNVQQPQLNAPQPQLNVQQYQTPSGFGSLTPLEDNTLAASFQDPIHQQFVLPIASTTQSVRHSSMDPISADKTHQMSSPMESKVHQMSSPTVSNVHQMSSPTVSNVHQMSAPMESKVHQMSSPSESLVLLEAQSDSIHTAIDPNRDSWQMSMVVMPYDFAYIVDDKESGNLFSHSESSDGKVTRGEYKVLLPDGRTQVVKFFDDGNGYNADVTYE